MSFTEVKIHARGADSRRYHEGNGASRGDADYEVSSSMLREFSHCASRWRAGYQPPETDAKTFGSLVDALVLTPGLFDSIFAVRPDIYKNEKGEEKPWHGSSNTCKQWLKDCEAEGRLPVERKELAEAQPAKASLTKDEILGQFIRESEFQVWLTGTWEDDATGLSVPVKALIDLVPSGASRFSPCLGDLKTTRSAKPGIWSRYSSQRGYHLQAALYIDLWNAATGEERDTFCHLLVENYSPYQIGRSIVSQEKLDLGRLLYQSNLAKYCRCLKTGEWPGYQSGPDVIDGWSLDRATKWELEAAMSELEQPETKQEPPVENEEDVPTP